MKLNKKHAFIIVALTFLLSAPAVSALNSGNAVVAQDIGEDFFFQLIEDGAEVVAAMIGPEGEPAVVYGQLGVPSARLALNDPMYEGCIVTALIATQGELMDYVLDLVGSNLLNFTGASFLNDDYMITQFPFGGEGMGIDSIFSMLGTDFSLLIDVFVNVDDATAQTNMAAIRTHLGSEFGFSFAELLNLRIDEEFIEGLVGEPVDLPFTGINVFIYQVTNQFEDAVDSVLDVMDQTGFLASIDRTVFSSARASGAGLLAVPDMGDLMDLIGSFGENTTTSPASFVISQLPDLDGPLAIAAAGYIGDQVLSTTSDELNIFEDLLGKSPLTPINGLASGQSLIAAFTPGVNITGYSPMGVNASYHDVNASVTFWNATHFTDQMDYTLNFDPGSFPPLVALTREFDPETVVVGGTVEVTVSVHNQGTEPIYNVSVMDNLIGTTYESVTVTGVQDATSAMLAGGAMLNITYQVTFQYEGGYAFAPAELSYDYNGTTYYKQTHIDGYTVDADPIGLLQQMFNDGMPFTAGIVGVVSLGAIVNIALMARRGGGGTYQV